ncbi:MAG TPA: hypothetical protein VIV60_22640, partial [Polyangiaceae bacterium]
AALATSLAELDGAASSPTAEGGLLGGGLEIRELGSAPGGSERSQATGSNMAAAMRCLHISAFHHRARDALRNIWFDETVG